LRVPYHLKQNVQENGREQELIGKEVGKRIAKERTAAEDQDWRKEAKQN